MHYTYIMIYNEFFTKQISFNEFMNKMDHYLKTVNPGELTNFHHQITDDSFVEYDPDMVMLTYLYLWLLPNRLNQQAQLTGADNIYLTFIKSVLDSYPLDFKAPLERLNQNLIYQIYKRGNVIIIFNTTETDIIVDVPQVLKHSTHYCINCSDEIDIDEQLELYPYGFYLIEI